MEIKHLNITEEDNKLIVNIQVKEVRTSGPTPDRPKRHYKTKDIRKLLEKKGCTPGKVLQAPDYISSFQGAKAAKGTWIFSCATESVPPKINETPKRRVRHHAASEEKSKGDK